jgi:hypothetical protein
LLTYLKLVLALSTVLLTSCSTVGGREESKLVGRWRSTDRQYTAEYAFFDNGTFSGSVTGGGTLVSRFAGKWSLRAGAIFYEYTRDEMKRIPVGTKDSDKLLRIGRRQYVIEAADGTVRTYERVGRD